jgi:hypothetical protein
LNLLIFWHSAEKARKDTDMALRIDFARTRTVRLAAQSLQEALKAPESRRSAEIREAKAWLLSAADEHEDEAAKTRNQMFAEAETTSKPEQVASDVMAAVLSDVHIANTLMAAGNALEETDAYPNPELLNQAVFGMQQATLLHEQTERLLAFSAEPIHSEDLRTARDTFQRRADETLNSLIFAAKDASGSLISAMKKLDGQKLLDGLAQLGGPLAELPKSGNLFRKGVEKMQNAFDFLRRVLDSELVSEVKEKLGELWSKIKDGTWADDLLGWAFNVRTVRELLAKAATSDKVGADHLDRATDSFAPLAENFSTEMKWAKTITSAVSFGSGLLLLAGVTAGSSALFLAGAYLSILSAILVMGRDSAGSGKLFHGNRGVRSIVEALNVA